MDSIPTLQSIFSKVPAAGTRDGTTVADTEGGQKAEQAADQAGDKLSQAANSAEQKLGQAGNAAEKKLGQAADQADKTLRGNAANSTSTTSASGSSASGSASKSSTGAVAVDKVTETSDKAADQTVAPAVEHDTIKRNHETRERDVVEKEIHKDHYHTTVQPLKDREVEETEHKFEQKPTEYRNVDKDDGAAEAKVADKLAGFEDTVDEKATKETKARDETVEGSHVHNHYHEVVQPVIEKEIVQNSVTHVTNPIKETVHEKSEDHGVTTASAMSVDDFKHKLGGEGTKKVSADKVLQEVKHADESK